MYTCPRCQTRLTSGVVRCGGCGADVTLLARLEEIPDQQFNGALAAYRRGDWLAANSLAGALLTARANDAEGWLLMGHVQAALGNRDGARHCWRTCGFLRPGDPRAAQALDSLDANARDSAARSVRESVIDQGSSSPPTD